MRLLIPALLAFIFGTVPAVAIPIDPLSRTCDLIEGAARQHDVPRAFFTRLIWQESRFNPNAVSPKGARGIAQFMPGTASLRGLVDPFDPRQALPASAHFLRDLHDQFGNWGLAAAGYNAGPGRVARWLATGGYLPAETENFVRIITGHSADAWANQGERPAKMKDAACITLATALGRGGIAPAINLAPWQPWGVQVAGGFSRAKALAAFDRLKRRQPGLLSGKRPMVVSARNRSRGRRAIQSVRLGANSRPAAIALCNRLKANGIACIVLRN